MNLFDPCPITFFANQKGHFWDEFDKKLKLILSFFCDFFVFKNKLTRILRQIAEDVLIAHDGHPPGQGLAFSGTDLIYDCSTAIQ